MAGSSFGTPGPDRSRSRNGDIPRKKRQTWALLPEKSVNQTFSATRTVPKTHLRREGGPYRGRSCRTLSHRSVTSADRAEVREEVTSRLPLETIAGEGFPDDVERAGVLSGRRRLQADLGQVERLSCKAAIGREFPSPSALSLAANAGAQSACATHRRGRRRRLRRLRRRNS